MSAQPHEKADSSSTSTLKRSISPNAPSSSSTTRRINTCDAADDEKMEPDQARYVDATENSAPVDAQERGGPPAELSRIEASIPDSDASPSSVTSPVAPITTPTPPQNTTPPPQASQDHEHTDTGPPTLCTPCSSPPSALTARDTTDVDDPMSLTLSGKNQHETTKKKPCCTCKTGCNHGLCKCRKTGHLCCHPHP